MNRAEIHVAVLLFLDQYIARGSEADLVSFRDELAFNDERWGLLDKLLEGDEWSIREAFRSMHDFFESECVRRASNVPPEVSSVSFAMITSDTDWYDPIPNPFDAVTSDPAQWYDWLDCVAQVKRTS